MAGLIFDEADARETLLKQMGDLVGKEGSEAIKAMIENGTKTGDTLATIFGVVTLLFAASGVFGELKSSMNAVWDSPSSSKGIISMLRARFLSFAMVLGTGFLLVISLLVSTLIAGLQFSATGLFPQMESLFHVLSFVVTIAVVTVLFALISRLLPDADVPWRHAWKGAILTAILFSLGKLAIGIYLGNSGLSSGYGAAGSLVVLIVWVYYSAQIMLFGAEITHVMARRRHHSNEYLSGEQNRAKIER